MNLDRLIKQHFPFAQMRPNQHEAIEAIVRSYLEDKKRFVILEGPTGSGKSVIAYTAAKVMEACHAREDYMQPFASVTVQSRMLQDQYDRSFEDVGNIWSAEHYTCNLNPLDVTAHYGSGNCKKNRCELYDECDYVVQRRRFFSADVGITNYSYFLLHPKIYSLMVTIDEAHNLEGSLCEWVKVEVSDRNIPFYLTQLYGWNVINSETFKVLSNITEYLVQLDDSSIDWLDDLRVIAREYSDRATTIAETLDANLELHRKGERLLSVDAAHKYTQYHKYFSNLSFRMDMLATLKTPWVLSSREKSKDEKHTTTTFKPIKVKEVSDMLYKKGQYFLLMSATICGASTMARHIGIAKDDYRSFSLPNRIPAERRPVFAIDDIGKMVQSNKDQMKPVFMDHTDALIEKKFQGVRGIIHCASYEYQAYIEENSRNVHRMRFPQRGEGQEVISMLEEADDIIVVSPCVVEGLDLQEDLCRFIIFFKTPWGNLQDAWVARKAIDNDWYARDTIVRLVQGSGRGTRSETDYAETYMLDTKFLDILKENKPKFPQWYRDSIQVVSLEDVLKVGD